MASHFLLGRGSALKKNDSQKLDTQTPSNQLIHLISQLEDLSKEFWFVWSKDYIRNLPPFKGQATQMEVKEGSVVVIEDEGPRLTWPLGIVRESLVGKDGITRAVRVGTEKGEIIRPVQRLHDLEIHSPLDSPLSCMDTSVIFAPSPPSSESLQSNTSKKDMFDSEDHHLEDFHTNTVKQTRRGRPVKPREILDL